MRCPPALLALVVLPLAAAANGQDVPDSVVISTHSSVLTYTPPWSPPWSKSNTPPYVCTHFAINPTAPPLASVVVSSTGLGRVLLSEGRSLSDAECQSAIDGETTYLTLTTVTGPRLIRARIPTAELVEPGSAIDGHFLVVPAGKKVVSAPVKVDRPARSPTVLSFMWFFGIAAPILVGLALNHLATLYARGADARRQENDKLQAFLRADNVSKWMKPFFEVHYRTIRHGKTFLASLRKDFDDHKVFENLPARQRRALERHIEKCRSLRVGWLLSRCFPQWRREILAQEKIALRQSLKRWRTIGRTREA